MGLVVFLAVLGLVVLGFGVRELFLQRRLQQEGVRVQGAVVRHVRRATSGRGVRYAMVGFAHEDGASGEIKVTSSGTRQWPVGREVPVVYLPGAPSTARLDLSSERRTIARLFLVVGVGFTIGPTLLMVFWRG